MDARNTTNNYHTIEVSKTPEAKAVKNLRCKWSNKKITREKKILFVQASIQLKGSLKVFG